MTHPDSSGEWPAADCVLLVRELSRIRLELAALPAPPYPAGWQADVARRCGHRPGDHAALFIDVDGEVLLDRLVELARLAVDTGRPISFM